MNRVFANPWRRMGAFLIIILICLVLTLFPERYRSAVTLAPSDPTQLGLSGALNQLGAASSVFGNQAAVEVTVKVANGVFVRDQVINKLDLVRRLHLSDRLAAHRWLESHISARSLRGSLVQVETKQSNRAFAGQVIQAYADAMRDRLATINRQQTRYKRQVLEKLVAEASDNLERAQTAYNNFRLETRYSDPAFAIEAIGARIPALEGTIKLKEVELNAARQFATDDNMTVRQILAELQSLRIQLAEQRALDPSRDNSVGRVVRQSTRAERLQRELNQAQGLYLVYNRYLEGTAVEDLTSTASLRVIEPPFIDTERQFNLIPLVLAMLVLLLGLAMEFYRLRPPLEARQT